MGTTIKFKRRQKYASFLIELLEVDNLVKSPYGLNMNLNEAIESILRTCRCPLRICVDTCKYGQVTDAVERVNNNSTELSKYRKNYSVQLYALN